MYGSHMEIEAGAGAGGSVEKGGGGGGSGSGILLRNEEQYDDHDHEMGLGLGYNLVWEDLTVVLPNSGSSSGGRLVSPRRVLRGLNGYAEPGRIMAIMGPSGSGKSTLLDSLAGRPSMNTVMTGNILLNGKKRRLDYGIVAYVTQEDVLLGTLTVRETIVFSANLRLPTSLTKEEVNEIVEGTIIEMGLQECADGMIGNWHFRGISGGEKKRLSIALEILTRPRLLFLDEPTSGLDSASAYFVIQSLRNVAQDGRTVISSIHQPSGEVFSLFDDLCLLSGGETVYFGDAKMAIKFFAESGFPCPSRRNPSDHFLRCINSDFDVVATTLKGSQKHRETLDPLMDMATTEIKTTLIHKYKCSEYASKARARIKQLTSIRGVEVEIKRGSQAGWLKQLSTLTKRSSINMSRDFGYYWLRLVIYIIVSVCVGTIYYDIGTSYNSIFARGACGAFISGFMTFMSIGGFPNFIEEMKVFSKERRNGYYGVAVFIVSNFVSSFPFLFIIAISTGTITYYLVKFRPGFSYYLFFSLNLLCNISAIESCMMVVASLVPNFLMGIVTGAGLIGIMMMTSGFFRLLDDLPKVFWRYPISYISFQSWALQGAYKNDLLGLEFDNQFPGMPKLNGSYVITKMYKIPLEHSKWWDLFAVLLILISYRIIFFLILKLKEHASPYFRSLYTKRAIHILNKRPSFRIKNRSFGSKRYIPPRSLSSQEGLTSPIS